MDDYGEQVRRVVEFARREFGAEPEFLWPERSPRYFVLRNGRTRKWFAVVMVVSGEKIGHGGDSEVEIIDLKFEPGEAMDFALGNEFVYPGYHMNKRNWITVPLDGSLGDEEVFGLVGRSYALAEGA